MNASLTEYLRDLADWIHHEAFHKLPDELEEKADEVRELAQTLESGVVVVPTWEIDEMCQMLANAIDGKMNAGTHIELLTMQRRWDNVKQVYHMLSRLQQNGGEER